MTASLVPALLITAASLGGSSRGVVLDFSAAWCGPCQEMSPIVSRLERQGYPIRQVDVDRERDLADRFGISSIPAFVLVVDGQEVTRITGKTSEEQLRRLLSQIPSDPPPVAAAPTARSASNGHPDIDLGPPPRMTSGAGAGEQRPVPQTLHEPPPSTGLSHQAPAEPVKSGGLISKLLGRNEPAAAPVEPAAIRGNLDDQRTENGSLLPVRDPVRASVRIHVTINGQTSVGSGTAIDSRVGRTVLVTCGHLFKGWNEQSKVEIEVFAEGRIQRFVGRMINYDVDADVGIVTIATDSLIATAAVPDVDGRPQAGDSVVNIGCSGGAAPSEEPAQVTALNYFEGPDNIECTGVPVQGRSGGGLFNRDGQLVGICIGADSQRQRGAYAGLLAIHDQLDAAGLTALYRRPAPEAAVAGQTPTGGASSPGQFDAFADASKPSPHVSASTDRMTSETAAAITTAGDAEVICIVRDRSQPGAPSRVVIIDRASPTFLGYLSGELNKTAMSATPPITRTNRFAAPAPSSPPQLADPQSLFRPAGSSRPLFTTPGEPRIGERSRSASLQPTALEEPFAPRRYVRSR